MVNTIKLPVGIDSFEKIRKYDFYYLPESVKFHFYKNKPISVVIFYRLHTNYNQSYRSKGHTTPLNFNNQFIMTY